MRNMPHPQKQNVFRDDELDRVIETLKTPLPSCFRINPNTPNFSSIQNALSTEFQFPAATIAYKGQPVTPPQKLTWFPTASGSAWQVECGKAVISKLARENDLFGRLHRFLMLHTASGAITRQEAVSMIPTLFLDVTPGQRVLDMCAAPGSKTSQIIETLTKVDNQDGFVVANDASEKRAFMLVHQTMRLGLLSAVVTNHQGQRFPGLYDSAGQLQTTNAFDRVLCDVPCTGDGTLRKNENIWRHWHVGDALTLHPIQLEIGLRGAALTKVGGRMVYSTCSFNPVENEAIVAELIRRSDGALRLVDASLPGLVHRRGLTKWQVAWQSKTKSKKIRKSGGAATEEEVDPLVWFPHFSEDIPADLRGYRLTKSMFPPDAADMNLDRCLRFLPHDQNTGGFFVAVLEKVAPLPGRDQEGLPAFEVNSELGPKCYRYVCRLCGETGHYIQDCKLSKKSQEKAATASPDALVTEELEHSDDESVVSASALTPLSATVWADIQAFYGIASDFPHHRLFARSHGTGIISYVSSSVQSACLSGPDLNLINTGVKVFAKFSTSSFKGYRPTQDGLSLLVPYLGQRKVLVGWSEFETLVAITSTKFFADMEPATASKFEDLPVGPVVVALSPRCQDSDTSTSIVGLSIWVGHTSLSKLVTTSDLQILADDLKSIDASAYAA
ncbi:Aste57867_18888 [Aphanomyces stellatus]|uniref:Aste57867_18888 protein n=1 Tax=Aphanomyces stellatus TaxID=120398 RepID=A0A485LD69_9STRA|nr:hypothetical protein As57867_018824 [Aphanomyces stellatus]VFT95621.1 Aste57867_18888 [Aphanomyces stellatus]